MATQTSAALMYRRLFSRYLSGAQSVRYFQSSAAQTQPLYPSVSVLIHEHNIPESEISKIPATGPKGRLLKGDVLSYIGAIASDYPSTLSSQISKLGHLDLSNVKPAAPRPVSAPPVEQKPPAPEPTEPEAPSAEVFEARLALPISLARVSHVQNRVRSAIGVTIPLETFIARATEIANDELPVTRQKTKQEIADQLFDEIVGSQTSSQFDLAPTSGGEYIPDIVSFAEMNSIPKPQTQAVDIIDILSGKAPVERTDRQLRSEPDEAFEEDPSTSLFSLTVPESERMRGQAFLERMQAVLENEPEKLVVL